MSRWHRKGSTSLSSVGGTMAVAAADDQMESGWRTAESAPALSFSRAGPDCSGVGCEAPVRRDVSLISNEKGDRAFEPASWSESFVIKATTGVQSHLRAATVHDPPWRKECYGGRRRVIILNKRRWTDGRIREIGVNAHDRTGEKLDIAKLNGTRLVTGH